MGSNQIVLSEHFWSGFGTGALAAVAVIVVTIIILLGRNVLHIKK